MFYGALGVAWLGLWVPLIPSQAPAELVAAVAASSAPSALNGSTNQDGSGGASGPGAGAGGVRNGLPGENNLGGEAGAVDGGDVVDPVKLSGVEAVGLAQGGKGSMGGQTVVRARGAGSTVGGTSTGSGGSTGESPLFPGSSSLSAYQEHTV